MSSEGSAPAEALRVVLVSHSAHLFGAEVSLALFAEELRRAPGVRVSVIAPRRGALVDRLRAGGTDVEVIRYHSWIGPRRSPARALAQAALDLAAVVRMVRRLRQLRPHVVVTNTSVVPWAAFASWFLRIPHVWMLSELLSGEQWGWHVYYGSGLTRRLLAVTATLLVANSETMAEIAQSSFPDRRVEVVSPPVPIPPDPPPLPHSEVLRVVCLGRVEENKAQHDLVEAIAALAGRGRRVEAELVGDASGVYARNLRHRVTALGVDDRVVFTGHVAEVALHFAWAHVAVTCSRFETFGRSTAEPMAFGRPVIGARGGATDELVRDGENGYRYEPGDPLDLADRLAVLDDDREELARLGEAARASSVRFAPAAVSATLHALLRGVAFSNFPGRGLADG